MHLIHKLIISSFFAFFSLSSLSAQTTINLGCQNSLDGVVDLDRKDWNNGSLALHSEGSFLNFDLPASTGDCMKITEVTFTLSVNSWDNSALPPGCTNDFYLNAYAADFLDVTPASVNTSLEALPPLFETDLFDLGGSYTIFCSDLELPFDGHFGVDVIVRAFGPACVDPQMLVSTGQVTMDYDVCVEAVIDVAGSAEVLAVSNGPDLCIGEELQFGENGLGNVDWSWTGPNGFNSSGIPDPTYTLSDPSDFGDYTVTVTDALGCTDEQTITINQLAAPSVTVSAVDLEVCPGQDITLMETGPDGTDWEWSHPNGFSAFGSPTVTIPNSTAANLGTYTVVVTGSNGCTSEETIEITPADPIAIDVTALETEICPGQDIFLEENGGEADTWSWSGPSFTSTEEDPAGFPGATGTYSVTVTDSGTLCTNVGSVTINPATPPLADADAIDINVCIGQDINLLGSGGGDYSWSHPNGFTSSDQNPSISGSTLNDFGIYTLTVTDGGGCTSTDEIEVFSIDSPTACIDGNGIICDGVCNSSNPTMDITVNSSSSEVDIEIQFSGTAIPNITLNGIQDGESILICADSDPALNNADYTGAELIIPTDGLFTGDIISIEIVSIVDPGNPACIGVLDPNCIVEFEYQEAVPPNIEYNGSVISDGDLISCDANFNPNIDVTISGTWLLDGNPITLPFDLTTYPAGNTDLAFEPDSDECASFVAVEFENVGCACEITDGLLSALSCNDNGTPSDDTDDFLTFELNPQVTNGGSSYTVQVSSGTITPASVNYGASTVFQMQNGSAGNGDITLTIEDMDDSSCTLDVSIIDPGSCSGTCNITSAIISLVECNDFLTPTDPTDDFIVYEIEVLGTNTGSGYTITSSYGVDMGTYGGIATFTLPSGSAGGGDVSLTIEDIDDSSCSFMVNLTDPGSCSGSCMITSAAIVAVQCDNAGTSTDPSDDFIVFDIEVNGSNTSTQYNINSALISDTGIYGTISNSNLQEGSAGGGNVTLTIVDELDSDCTFQIELIDPGSCSGACFINMPIANNVLCNDNGTPLDPTDDFITFDLDPQGDNLVGDYTIVAPEIAIGQGGSFGTSTNFATLPGSAGNGMISIDIISNLDPNCTADFFLDDPGTCSNACEITTAELTEIECVDPNTPANSSDDGILFNLLVSGTNVGSGYTITTAFGNLSGNYDTQLEFPLAGAAGQGDLILTIVDNDNPNCSFDVNLTDPGSCSDACEIIEANVSYISCQDNGTDSDDMDDFISFTLDPEVSNGSSQYIVSVSPGNVTPNIANYGMQTSFELQNGSAGGGNISVTVIDENNVDCTFEFNIQDTGTCSGTCNISSVIIDPIDCDDGGTETDDSDDSIIFDIIVEGSNTSTDYSVNSIYDSVISEYGTLTTIVFPPGTAGSGDIELTIVDNDDPDCTFQIILPDPGNCSTACELTELGESNISCQDNGTDSDETDDYMSFSLNPEVTNGSSGYIISASSGAVIPNVADYGSETSFDLEPGSAGSGNVTITVIDQDNPSCFLELLIADTGSCSGTCNITDADLSQVNCDPNGTDSDTGDDLITFDIEVTGSNTSSGYTLTSSFGSESGDYNTNETFSFPQGSAGAGDVAITIVDNDDPTCTFDTTVLDPGSCSSDCEILDVIVDNVFCNNNGTDEDASDDIINFEIEPVGTNLTGEYTLDGQGIDPALEQSFGGPVAYSSMPGAAGQGDIVVTLSSVDNPSCIFSFTIPDPGICSSCIDPGDCDDGDCSNGLESWDNQICDCVSTDPPTCENSELITMVCDDLNPCTENDVIVRVECTDEVCVPCLGTPINCEDEGNTFVMECNDNDSNTINDVETLLACDSTVCIPCQGILNVPTIFVPNIFTPNDDGDNDDFNIYSSGEFIIQELSIYDRWGELLYRRENILSTDPDVNWDGRFNGTLVMPGVYVYYIELGEPFNKVEAGDFTIYH